MNALDINNIVAGNGITISLTGMSIVFSGLLLISFSLWLLPRVIALLERGNPMLAEAEKTETSPSTNQGISTADNRQGDDSDIAGIIGLVLQIEDQLQLAKAASNPQSMPN
jgi:oxaloacetate decarboxylase gamma subunit